MKNGFPKLVNYKLVELLLHASQSKKVNFKQFINAEDLALNLTKCRILNKFVLQISSCSFTAIDVCATNWSLPQIILANYFRRLVGSVFATFHYSL